MSDDEHVLSVWIGEAPAGQAAVQLVAMGDDGHRVVERLQGECAKMREFVDELTVRHDLVPIWDDHELLSDGSHRPPAPFYTSRDLAPPTHLVGAS